MMPKLDGIRATLKIREENPRWRVCLCPENWQTAWIVEDLVQIITVFSCKLQGKRANKAKKLIRELIQEETDGKSHKSNVDTKQCTERKGEKTMKMYKKVMAAALAGVMT